MKPHAVKFLIQENNVTYYAWWTVCRDFTCSKVLKKYLGSSFVNQLIIFRNGDAKWGTDIYKWYNFGESLLEKIISNQFYLKGLVEEHYKFGTNVNKLCNFMETYTSSQLSNKQLYQWFKAVIHNYLLLNELGFIPVTSDLEHGLLSNHLKTIVENKHISEEQVQIYLNALMTSDKKTLSWLEYYGLLRLAIKYPSKTELAKSKVFLAHIKKYCWINYGYKGPEWTKEDFLSRIDKLRAEHKDLQKEMENHLDFLHEIKQRRIYAERKLGLTMQEKRLFETARIFSYLKAYRVNVRHYFCYVSYLLFDQLSRRFNVPVLWFEYATEEEILSLIQGKKPNINKVISRSKFYSELSEGNKFKEFTETALNKLLKQIILKEKIAKTNTLTGQVAYTGKVTGKAKIIFSPKDIHKVQKGDILVAVYTDPNLLPAMEKAAAFVTEQGGITSHAAIVAREMKKPCVIGTKIATKVLKDGEMVEVDANKGIIKKLS